MERARSYDRAVGPIRVFRLVEPPPVDDGQAWDVFLAYAHVDEKAVLRLAKELNRRQLRVFFDRWEIGPGQETRQRLEQGLGGCAHGLVVMSSHTLTRPWVQAEYSALLDRATTQGSLLIPVLIGSDDTALPPFLRARHPVDLRGVSTEDYRERIGAVARAIRGQRPGPPSRMRGRSRSRE